ncbi:hypothetical protein BBOV_III008770 [Babesia bovis T2Bo]|uniref:Uncharacterized protein n=1 Tax=Babesia bovis TaxID=5865 RepID=A7APF1_BABBO|nr:hypothetical protein BBOV_III008770 [Babesia bovis T2Bo]EDO08435.1 hypothetical protein BBOV_III008770 [Babesia bovis T2Bo]BAN64194.1 conserved hypothetical protein [Babesia bovis]|eukprot:XP_001612003.1 hypothetical protein [Babesia bovis T2Bo]
MGSKIWKDYVHRHLRELEASSADNENDSPFVDSAQKPNTGVSEPLSWCRSLERSIAYTFESYCKIVVTTAIKRAHAKDTSDLDASGIKDTITTLFPSPPSAESSMDNDAHDIHRCADRFRGYLRWYRNIGHRIYNQEDCGRTNTSCHRKIKQRVKYKYKYKGKSQRDANLVSKALDLQRYAFVRPYHRSRELALNDVFDI